MSGITGLAGCLLALGATIASAQAPGRFAAGQKITFEDVANRYGGGTIPGTIVEDMGSYGYKVHVDVPANPAFQTISLYANRLTAAGPAAPQPAAPRDQPAASPRPANPVAANPRPPATAGDLNLDNRPARGKVFVGGVNPNPTLGHNAPTPPGRKKFYVHSRAAMRPPPGAGIFGSAASSPMWAGR